jgi:hypothetical protein
LIRVGIGLGVPDLIYEYESTELCQFVRGEVRPRRGENGLREPRFRAKSEAPCTLPVPFVRAISCVGADGSMVAGGHRAATRRRSAIGAADSTQDPWARRGRTVSRGRQPAPCPACVTRNGYADLAFISAGRLSLNRHGRTSRRGLGGAAVRGGESYGTSAYDTGRVWRCRARPSCVTRLTRGQATLDESRGLTTRSVRWG